MQRDSARGKWHARRAGHEFPINPAEIKKRSKQYELPRTPSFALTRRAARFTSASFAQITARAKTEDENSDEQTFPLYGSLSNQHKLLIWLNFNF